MLTGDMHCDTLTEVTRRSEANPSFSFMHNDMMINLDKLIKSDYLFQNFAIFTYLKGEEDPAGHVRKNIKMFHHLMSKYAPYIAQARNVQEIEDNHRKGLISAVLTLEEGAVINHDLKVLDEYYEQGVRMVALSWNFDNGLTHPNFHGGDGYHTYDDAHGLTDEGKAYVKEMEKLGMIIDVSHMSDACFYDVYEMTSLPFVASHSNARAVTDHARNMSDDMILKLADRGGVMGINFEKKFVCENGHPSIDDVVKHINYIRDLAGIDVIGLGSDFDGIREGAITSASDMPKIAEALKKEGYSKQEIEKIFYKNVLRVYSEVLR